MEAVNGTEIFIPTRYQGFDLVSLIVRAHRYEMACTAEEWSTEEEFRELAPEGTA